MMTQMEMCDDMQLVERCLGGDREAFGRIVERYQGLVCALAYNACGNVSRSEDLAQETFLAAWRNLGSLKDRGRFRQWLCGIARHLIQESFRRATRDPLTVSAPLEEDVLDVEESLQSGEREISEEEQAVLWRVLEGLPATYREPLILFYRRNQSVTEVAETLGLSEDGVKQRLSRGRVMLGERVSKFVETALNGTGPKKTFTSSVLAALPAMGTSTKAAVAGATAVKGSAAVKVAGLTGLANAVSLYFMYALDRDGARSPQGRRLIARVYIAMMAFIAVFGLLLLSLRVWGNASAMSHPALCVGLFVGLEAAFVLGIVALNMWMMRQRRSLRQQEIASGRQLLTPVPLWEYRSKFSLLGLPLIHIRLRGGVERGPVKAWFAAGDMAVGVIFAFGGIAIAPISVGGLSAGLVTLGGIALGVAPFGGFSFGQWALGGIAVGWQAFGGCAVGWQAAQGGVALAHDFAVGSVAFARHANNGAARAFIQNGAFFRCALVVMRYVYLINLLLLLPPALWWWQRKKKQQQPRSGN